MTAYRIGNLRLETKVSLKDSCRCRLCVSVANENSFKLSKETATKPLRTIKAPTDSYEARDLSNMGFSTFWKPFQALTKPVIYTSKNLEQTA